ncbi:GvpL/GvpF family gas vesicle protein [Methylobacter psychrophilus]|uniref:GvpL/GvpF family gas vesicle protein n=1 Tax=Methylobacter psychrophilus TaxID=96941 RepID=UPI0021D50B07|nr:GvpL/GvpF family gas vesicle protein [Methylobacter psychrophilus]
MMSLLLYGIIADDDAQLVVEPTMRLIKAAGLAAIVTVCEVEISREPALVLAFGDQVMHIHQQTTVIPMRYGSVLVDEDSVINHLHEHEADYQTRLAELDNCEEMGIRITLDLTAEDEVIAKPLQVSGYNYLLARKRAYAIPEKAERQAILINNALSGLYRQHCAALSVFNGQHTYLLSYLVPRTVLPEFCERLNALAESIADLGFISGPWPPYNFAS